MFTSPSHKSMDVRPGLANDICKPTVLGWIYKTRLAVRCTVLLMSIHALCGCAANPDTGVYAFNRGNYAAAASQLEPLALKTNEDYVLNNVRLGSVYLACDRLDDAERAFLRAYEVIQSVDVNNGARSVITIVVDEKTKIWKGEPFERASVNFYLGTIYYLKKDYNNARAAFENALFKLQDYADDEADNGQFTSCDSNFASAQIMLARCWMKLGREDKARACFDAIRQYRPDLGDVTDYDRHAKANLVLLIEVGRGPRRQYVYHGMQRINDGTNIYEQPLQPEFIGFYPKPAEAQSIPSPEILIDGVSQDLEGLTRPPVDLLALAQEHKWNGMDTIHQIKDALEAGALLAAELNPIGMLAAGLIGMTNQPDPREWGMLPRTTLILPLTVSAGHHHISGSFPSGSGIGPIDLGVDVPSSGDEVAALVHTQATYDPDPVMYAYGAPGPDDLSAPDDRWEVRIENRTDNDAVVYFDQSAVQLTVPACGSNFCYLPAGNHSISTTLDGGRGHLQPFQGYYAIEPETWLAIVDHGLEICHEDPASGFGPPARRVRANQASKTGQAMAQRIKAYRANSPRSSRPANRVPGKTAPPPAVRASPQPSKQATKRNQ